MLAEAGLVISAGKMSNLWSGQPVTIRLDDLEVLCEVLGCEPGDLLVREPGKARRGHPAQDDTRAAAAGRPPAVPPRPPRPSGPPPRAAPPPPRRWQPCQRGPASSPARFSCCCWTRRASCPASAPRPLRSTLAWLTGCSSKPDGLPGCADGHRARYR